MKLEFVTSEVSVEIHENMPIPIIINSENGFISLTFEELEKVYQYAKSKLATH